MFKGRSVMSYTLAELKKFDKKTAVEFNKELDRYIAEQMFFSKVAIVVGIFLLLSILVKMLELVMK